MVAELLIINFGKDTIGIIGNFQRMNSKNEFCDQVI